MWLVLVCVYVRTFVCPCEHTCECHLYMTLKLIKHTMKILVKKIYCIKPYKLEHVTRKYS